MFVHANLKFSSKHITNNAVYNVLPFPILMIRCLICFIEINTISAIINKYNMKMSQTNHLSQLICNLICNAINNYEKNSHMFNKIPRTHVIWQVARNRHPLYVGALNQVLTHHTMCTIYIYILPYDCMCVWVGGISICQWPNSVTNTSERGTFSWRYPLYGKPFTFTSLRWTKLYTVNRSTVCASPM